MTRVNFINLVNYCYMNVKTVYSVMIKDQLLILVNRQYYYFVVHAITANRNKMVCATKTVYDYITAMHIFE